MHTTPLRSLLLAALLNTGLCAGAAAQGSSVALQGIMGSKALLVIDGRAPKALGPGESLGAVKVIAVQGEQARITIDGTPATLRLGEAQSSVQGKAPPAGGSQISMASDANGHFMAQGLINGKPTRFMVDTGATTVAMSLADAVKLGVDYRKGRPIQVGTANGMATGYALRLHSVRIGDVEVYDVDAVVTAQRMPFVLLGNSFLNRFQMRRDADIMVLTRR